MMPCLPRPHPAPQLSVLPSDKADASPGMCVQATGPVGPCLDLVLPQRKVWSEVGVTRPALTRGRTQLRQVHAALCPQDSRGCWCSLGLGELYRPALPGSLRRRRKKLCFWAVADFPVHATGSSRKGSLLALIQTLLNPAWTRPAVLATEAPPVDRTGVDLWGDRCRTAIWAV